MHDIFAYCISAHCSIMPTDLRIDEHPSCYLTFVQVGGVVDVIKRGCKLHTIATPIMGQDMLQDQPSNSNNEITYNVNNFTCIHDIENDYETNCICKTDYCNNDHFPLPTPPRPEILDTGYKLVVDEVNRSIRQLRSDMKRTILEEIRKASLCN